jgi:cobalt-zinc-cadmium efflux system protein
MIQRPSPVHDHHHSADHDHSLAHSHARTHAHAGGHAHQHLPKDFGRAFAVGITLNIFFVAVEVFFGWQADSLALLADAAHNLSDVGGLVLAWAAIIVAKRRPSKRYTYGLQRGSIIAGFINAVVLLFAMGSLAWEAVLRLQNPDSYNAPTVMWVALAGVFVNGFTAWLFLSGSKSDVNIRGAFLHMVSDALVSVGVIVSAAIYMWLGWLWLDPVVSLIIALLILAGTWSLFTQSLHLMFDGVPRQIDLDRLNAELLSVAGVKKVHDLHVWAMASTKLALTAHLVLADTPVKADEVLAVCSSLLAERFGIVHSTLQLESSAYSENCVYCDSSS